MKSSDNPKNKTEPESSNLNDLLKKNTSKREDAPAEEFISESNQSVPDENVGSESIDSMGISEKAKNQPSDEKDVSENKK